MSDLILKAVPEDVRKIILAEQLKEKTNRGTNQYSLSSVIYKMLRDYIRCRDLNNFKSE